MIEADDGDTLTVVTTGVVGGGGVVLLVTVIAAAPDADAHVAVMLAEPAAIAFADPLALTVTMAVFWLAQVSALHDIAAPDWSFTVAASVCDAPTARDAVAGDTLTVVATGVGGVVDPLAGVVAAAMFDNAPYVAFRFIVPRKAMTWKLYAVDAARPDTVQVSFAPIAVPTTGIAQVPLVTLGAEPHDSGGFENRMS